MFVEVCQMSRWGKAASMLTLHCCLTALRGSASRPRDTENVELTSANSGAEQALGSRSTAGVRHTAP